MIQELLASQPAWFYCVLAILIIALAVKVFTTVDNALAKLIHRNKPSTRRDPTRVFTRAEKDAALRKCEYRCEGTGVLWRCRYRGRDLHGDHWFPYSRGGATNEKNLVMLCPTCNRRKSDKIPTRLQTWRLHKRRLSGRDYRPTLTHKPGEWLDRKFVNENPRFTKKEQRVNNLRRPTF